MIKNHLISNLLQFCCVIWAIVKLINCYYWAILDVYPYFFIRSVSSSNGNWTSIWRLSSCTHHEDTSCNHGNKSISLPSLLILYQVILPFSWFRTNEQNKHCCNFSGISPCIHIILLNPFGIQKFLQNRKTNILYS